MSVVIQTHFILRLKKKPKPKPTTDPKYYMNKYGKDDLIKFAKVKYGIEIENPSKKELSEIIVQKEMEAYSNEDDLDSTVNLTVTPTKMKEKAFLQRLMPHWFMKPFGTKEGDCIETGLHNENFVISSLKGYVKSLSDNKYNIGKLLETGLLINRKVQVSGTSPDGIVELYQCTSGRKMHFLGLCVLEIKTKNTVTTATRLDHDIAKLGGPFNDCNAGDIAFKKYVPEPAYRSQISQHACVTGLKYAMIAYSIPGGIIKRIVLVRYKANMLVYLSSYQDEMRKRYMDNFYSDDDNNNLVMQSIGQDYDNVYGYAQEHHTVELYMRLWKRHNNDVIENGTPPTIKKIIESSCSTWNKCMGNVHIVRKTLGNHKTKRGSNTKPGFLSWYTIFQYVLYQTFRTYTYSLLEKKLSKVTSFMQLQDKRKHIMSFKDFLSQISARDSFCISEFEKFYPGLREKFNQSMRSQKDDSKDAHTTAIAKESTVDNVSNDYEYNPKYKVLELFNNSTTEEYRKRLDNSLLHTLSANTEFDRKGVRRARLRCIMCCVICLKEDKKQKEHGRVGQTTSKFCPICKVVLCTHCFESFHREKNLKIPQCVLDKMTVRISQKCVTAETVSNEKSPSIFLKKKRKMTLTRNIQSTPQLSKKKEKLVTQKSKRTRVMMLKELNLMHHLQHQMN